MRINEITKQEFKDGLNNESLAQLLVWIRKIMESAEGEWTYEYQKRELHGEKYNEYTVSFYYDRVDSDQIDKMLSTITNVIPYDNLEAADLDDGRIIVDVDI